MYRTPPVLPMAMREIYGQTFDEDVSSDQSATCAECGGQVRTNSMETACEDCGLLIDEQRIDHGPEWRTVGDESDILPKGTVCVFYDTSLLTFGFGMSKPSQ